MQQNSKKCTVDHTLLEYEILCEETRRFVGLEMIRYVNLSRTRALMFSLKVSTYSIKKTRRFVGLEM